MFHQYGTQLFEQKTEGDDAQEKSTDPAPSISVQSPEEEHVHFEETPDRERSYPKRSFSPPPDALSTQKQTLSPSWSRSSTTVQLGPEYPPPPYVDQRA